MPTPRPGPSTVGEGSLQQAGEHEALTISPEPHACPSSLCQEGALLLGIMTSSGHLAYVQPPTRIDADFVARARRMGRPEARFRFSAPCIEAGCPQWTGKGCGVVEHLLHDAMPATEEALPACAIRRSCRWFAERGAAACHICPTVVADTGGSATYQSLALEQGGAGN